MIAAALLLLVATPDIPARIVGEALTSSAALRIVEDLSDGIGPRLTGSRGASAAVHWAVAEMKARGFSNVHEEPVTVPRWERRGEMAQILGDPGFALHVTALGGSVATPDGGIRAEVIEAHSMAELKALGAKARGKIVLVDVPMRRSTRGMGYFETVDLRGSGPSIAANAGAIAFLIRSLSTARDRLPHTGATHYADGIARIPAAALAVEDSLLVHRRIARGKKVTIRLELDCGDRGTVRSANVIGEMRGRDRAREIVLLGAHLDSWDLGTGAIDDAAGCAIVLEAARIAALRDPRRTLRVVLFMNEEHGLSGARAYAAQHAGELALHVAALEADSGSGKPIAFLISRADPGLLRSIAAPLAGLGVERVVRIESDTGADLIPLEAAGVPQVGVAQDMSRYFDWHHSAGDTFDKIEPRGLALTVAATALLAYGLANSETVLPRTRK